MNAGDERHAREPSVPNHLAGESSPYLLQHRNNPVDWYPWGEPAFAEARKRDVPIFLSIGYSTCYWCHVMERESFEDAGLAERLNRSFVCVKVDREERPDVDDVYMAAVLAFTGRGGWPMSVFLEPKNLRPFWAGTYFSKEPKFSGVPTFGQVLDGIDQAWRSQRAEVLEQAGKLAEAVGERVAESAAPVRLDEQPVRESVVQLLRLLDQTHGGFGPAPKFPQPVFVELLLDVRRAVGDEDTRRAIDHAVSFTLEKMALGGIFDQVGGGFHRYSVDQTWTVPHFEKMLYDNAQLLGTYARAWSATRDELFKRVVERTAAYLEREMTAPEGAFVAAQDAEVNHREGQNYLWTQEQMDAVLPAEDAQLAREVYGLNAGANFRDPHHPEDAPSNVLRLSKRPESFAKTRGLDERALLARLDAINQKLYDARSGRDQPGVDTKIIAGWNGLAIGALADAAYALAGDGIAFDATALPMLVSAQRAAECVLDRLMMRRTSSTHARLFRVLAGGRASIDGFLEDYALVAHGFLRLARARGERAGVWVDAAAELLEAADERFGERGEDGVFHGVFDMPDPAKTEAGQPRLFVRTRSVHDGALPSGASSLLGALIDAGELTGRSEFIERAARLCVALSGTIAASPLGSAQATRGLLRLLAAHRDVLERAQAHVSMAPGASAAVDEDSVVEILSDTEGVQVGVDAPAELMLRVRIAPGYHVTAPDLRDASGAERVAGTIQPLRVHAVGGTGIRVYAEYPAGVVSADDPDVFVYEGEVDVRVAVERDGEWTGTPLIGVTYQACREDACLAVRTVELDVSVDRV